MDGICLIFDTVIPSIEEISATLSGFDQVQPQPRQIFVGHDDRRLWIRPDWEDLDTGSIEAIRYEWPQHTLPAYPSLVSIDSWHDPIIMAVVRQLAARWTFLINTDRGEDYTSSASAARYDAEPEWNWGAILDDSISPFLHTCWPPSE